MLCNLYKIVPLCFVADGEAVAAEKEAAAAAVAEAEAEAESGGSGAEEEESIRRSLFGVEAPEAAEALRTLTLP